MKALPETLEARYELALKKVSAPQKVCLLQYIFENPNSFTHLIARDCAIGYPPARIWELNREVLWEFGLQLSCYKPHQPLVNRFGMETGVQQWRLELLGGAKHDHAA